MRISDSSIEKILRQGEVISESRLAELKMEAESIIDRKSVV